jgi:hypothetical protein
VSEGTLVPIRFAINDRPMQSETHYIRFSPYVLSVRTVLPETPLCVELHSVFTGHAYIESHATHLLIGPLGCAPRRINRDHVREGVDPVLKPRSCVLEHALQLIEVLSVPGRVLTVPDVADGVLAELEQLPH